MGGLLAAHTPDGDWFYAYDGNGNVTTLVNTSDGAISATYDYSPFGLTVSQSGVAAAANTYRFSTKTLDESGLYYYGFRHYNPSQGRWMSREPKRRERDGRNLFVFLKNQPLGDFDYLGLLAVCCEPVDGRQLGARGQYVPTLSNQ